MEYMYKGIVVGAKDFKENDKMISLFTLQDGLVNIALRGVKKPGAKLKYAKELFTFGDFFVASKNNFNILTACDVVENFSDLSANPTKYLDACEMANLLYKLGKNSDLSYNIFIEFLNALKTLCYENTGESVVLSKFYLSFLKLMGYKLSLEKCSCCGNSFMNKQFLNLETGEFVCSACKQFEVLEVSNLDLLNLRLLSNTGYEKLSTLKLNGIKNTCNLLKTNIKYRIN